MDLKYIFPWVASSVLLFNLTLCDANISKAAIFTVDSIKAIEDHLSDDTLVVLDLDHTVFEGAHYGYGHCNWYYDQLDLAKKLGHNETQYYNKFYPHWLRSQHYTKVKPVEDITPEFIKSLQRQNFEVIGVTKRGPKLANATLRQLEDIAIDFSQSFLIDSKFNDNFIAPSIAKNGVIFGGDFNDKGEVLYSFLVNHRKIPKKLIVLEDKHSNILEIINAFKDQHTQVIGLHYPLVENIKLRNWDVAKAKQEYYERYLQDKDLAPYFLEDRQKIKAQTDKLLENQNIDHPFEFVFLNNKYVALPGVYADSIFGNVGKLQKLVPITKGVELLEIGPATGYFSTHAALKGAKKVVATDIMEAAVKNTKLNASRFNVADVVDVRLGDIFSAIKHDEKFNIIFWEIPVNHTEKVELSLFEQTIYDPDYKLLTRFLSEAGNYLHENGVVYLAYSPSHGDVEYLKALAKHNKWQYKVVYRSFDNDMELALYAFSKDAHAA